jgi:hypothetical protein
LPYDGYGLVIIAPITGSGVRQAVTTASNAVSTLPNARWAMPWKAAW